MAISGYMYLDTSTVNLILDHGMGPVLGGVDQFEEKEVLVSAVNLEEVFATSNHDRRAALGGVLKQLSRGRRPLARPDVILGRSLHAYVHGGPQMRWDIGEEDDGYWSALSDGSVPDEIANGLREEQKEKLSSRRKRAQQLRVQIQRVTEAPTVSCAASHLRACASADDSSVEDVVGGMFSRYGVTGAPRSARAIREALHNLEPWKFVLAAECHNVFLSALRDRPRARWRVPGCNGGSQIAGPGDIAQVVYLGVCETFVVSDLGFYKLLRMIRPLSNAPKNIVFVPNTKGARIG